MANIRTNLQRNGFMFFKPKSGVVGMVEPIPCFVASGYNTADLYVGDPVSWVNDGSVGRTAAGGGTGIFGVITSILQFRNADGVLVRNGKYIPSGTTWTADAERTQVMVMPAVNALFEVDANDGSTITTIAGARSVAGENCDHVYGTADQGLALSGALLNISTHAVTATLQWRVLDVVNQPGNDLTQTHGRYVVYANVLNNWGALPAVLGV
jgi:hypothetical protein